MTIIGVDYKCKHIRQFYSEFSKKMVGENICFQCIACIMALFVKYSDDFTFFYKNECINVDGG